MATLGNPEIGDESTDPCTACHVTRLTSNAASYVLLPDYDIAELEIQPKETSYVYPRRISIAEKGTKHVWVTGICAGESQCFPFMSIY